MACFRWIGTHSIMPFQNLYIAFNCILFSRSSLSDLLTSTRTCFSKTDHQQKSVNQLHIHELTTCLIVTNYFSSEKLKQHLAGPVFKHHYIELHRVHSDKSKLTLETHTHFVPCDNFCPHRQITRPHLQSVSFSLIFGLNVKRVSLRNKSSPNTTNP